MDATLFALVILSALMHPVREVLLKRSAYPEGLAYAVMMLFGVFSGLQVLASGQEPWSAFRVWPAVIASGVDKGVPDRRRASRSSGIATFVARFMPSVG